MTKIDNLASSRKQTQGPKFVRLFVPVIDVLRELGESGRPKEVSEKVATRLKIIEQEINQTNKNGRSRFENQVAWARFYLAKAGIIDTSRHGVWTLTEKGRSGSIDDEHALLIFREVQGSMKKIGRDIDDIAGSEERQPPDMENSGDNSFRNEMTEILTGLSPAGFERLCQRILREVGFEEVTVTGRSNDGGIDGYGKMRINRLISDRVIFQCKKHTTSISPSYIREFRGTMLGRADRGIFLATSTFSAEAKREAARDGAAPIEMVDLDALIKILSDFGLGVEEYKVYRVVREFFLEYMPKVTPPKIG